MIGDLLLVKYNYPVICLWSVLHGTSVTARHYIIGIPIVSKPYLRQTVPSKIHPVTSPYYGTHAKLSQADDFTWLGAVWFKSAQAKPDWVEL